MNHHNMKADGLKNMQSDEHQARMAVACNPKNSVVVEACAGSGKTWLLTARMFRLLLAGVSPDEILAITFTRKAAHEMQARLLNLLSDCAKADDATLDVILLQRGVQEHQLQSMRMRARSLAGEVLTHPRGVQINTFHGWFASLCQLAPLSVGFSRQSEPTEAPGAYMQQAIDAVITNIVHQGDDSPMAQAINTLSKELGVVKLMELLLKALQNRLPWQMLNDHIQNQHQDALPFLEQYFGVELTALWPIQVLQNACLVQAIEELTSLLAMGSDSQQEKSNALQDTLHAVRQLQFNGDDASLTAASDLFDKVYGLFFNDKNEPRKLPFKPTKAQQKNPQFDESIYLQRHECVLYELQHAKVQSLEQTDLKHTWLLWKLMPDLMLAYARIKAKHGVCDFDDLEHIAFMLLQSEAHRHYINQRLDARLRHILLDEFQDTNPVQWQILRMCMLEMREAHANEDVTVFLVGDPKQSIYRFRGADVAVFHQAKQWLKQHLNAHELESDTTRRCAASVVEVVNHVFVHHHNGMSNWGNTVFRMHHTTVQVTGHASGMYVYPLIEAVEHEADMVLARQTVAQLKHDVHHQRIQCLADVLVLVRTHRSAYPLVLALREAQMPFVLQDQGERFTSMVWSDSIAILKFLHDAHDSMALLQVLRSPLFCAQNADIQQLIELAWQQRKQGYEPTSVWVTLNHLAHTEQELGKPCAAWAAWAALLQEWRVWAQQMPLFETLYNISHAVNAPLRYLLSASPQYRDLFVNHWDWLQNWALNVSQGRFVTLPMAILEAERLQQQGSADAAAHHSNANALRIMTIHAAKGLEAPHVWLYDAHVSSSSEKQRTDSLLVDWAAHHNGPSAWVVLSTQAAKFQQLGQRAALLKRNDEAECDEKDHLLYVALTRAKHSIHVCGKTVKNPATRNVYNRLSSIQACPSVHERAWATVATACEVSAQQQSNNNTVEMTAEMIEWHNANRPEVPMAVRPVGTILPNALGLNQRMSVVWHALLGEIMAHVCHKHIALEVAQTMPLLALSEQGITLPSLGLVNTIPNAAVLTVWQAVQAVLQNPTIAQWLHHAQHCWVEPEWLMYDVQPDVPSVAQGKAVSSHRADVVLCLPEAVWVLDFKWQIDALVMPQYQAQLARYVGIVQRLSDAQNGVLPSALCGLPVNSALVDHTGVVHLS